MEEELKRLRAELESVKAENAQLRRAMDVKGSDPIGAVGSAPGGEGLGIRVLDLTRVLAGPFCSMLLADMGAEVIKLERPGSGDDSRQFPPFVEGTSLYYVNLNRGKRSIVLDLKTAAGKAVFCDLVRVSDVVLENFSPGTMERLGLGYTQLRALNPRLVYVSISGFGQTGALRSRPGYDIIAQAMSGLMSITGWPDSPPTRAGTAVGDILAAMFTCVGILAALRMRDRLGEGQMVDVALVDALFSSMGQHLQKIFVEDAQPGRIGNRYEFIAPYDSFHASDGWVIIAIANDELWARFLAAVEPEPEAPIELRDEQFRTNGLRLEHCGRLKALIECWTRCKRVDDIVCLLLQHRVPACPILSLADAARGSLAQDRDMVVELQQPDVGLVRLLGNAIKMSRTDTTPRHPAPSLGQDTEAVLRDLLHYSDDQIHTFFADHSRN